MAKIEFNEIEYDSWEEIYFVWWLEEMIREGFIDKYYYQKPTLYLSPKVYAGEMVNYPKKGLTYEIRQVMESHVYTPDFLILWNKKAVDKFYYLWDYLDTTKCNSFFWAKSMMQIKSLLYELLYNEVAKFKPHALFSMIDIKGSYIGPHNNSAITFPINDKWVYDKYQMRIQKVIPCYKTKAGVWKGLFPETFTPHRYLHHNKGKGLRKIHFKPRTIDDYTR